MKTKTQKIILSAMFAALACVATMIIRIPSPLNGYINLGDVIVLVCGWKLFAVYGFCAAAIGSALADAFAGYFVYVPATFLIKGLMALCAYFLFAFLNKKMSVNLSRILSGVVAEVIMIVGYFVFEGVLYGFPGVVVNILPNALQGLVGIALGTLLARVFDSMNIFEKL